jgi:hypothetical protein
VVFNPFYWPIFTKYGLQGGLSEASLPNQHLCKVGNKGRM